MRHNVLDLFCGAGGLSLGFKMAGFDIVGGVEFNQEAIDTHALNFKNGYHFCGDISSLTNEFILEKFENKVDERNKLFYQFIRFVEVLKPKAFVMENVRGILTKDGGHVKEAMMKIMDDLGYNVDVRVLTASDYGVPQKRMRAFFVGIKKEIGEAFDFDKIQKKPTVTVKDAIGDIYDLDNKIKSSTVEDKFTLEIEPSCEYQKLMRKDSDNILHNHNIKYPKDIVQTRMSYVPEGANWNRAPTARESARIQSFPDDFIFTGGQGAQFRQVGNAVPPLLSKAIAETLKTYLDKNTNEEEN